MEKYTDELVLMIIGNEKEELDGKIIKSSYKDSHLHSIIELSNILKEQGINLEYFNKNTAEEAAFDIVKKGYILLFNVYDVLAFLKLPKTITLKQYKVLELLEKELSNFVLYEQVINPENEEEFSSIEHDKNFVLKKEKYNIKEVN
ncbi:MAG TPA: hypothetical protein PLV83_05755 [Bacilli bacterium]|nr:hypothetical protein [Bacilli bacterium]